eukprot:Ihof_evm2s842 gene=Ihof_evmTU2s842
MIESTVGRELKTLVFGDGPPNEVTERWRQGFVSRCGEREGGGEGPALAGLVQFKGGPCAVLAPIQAYLIHYFLNTLKDQWETPTPEQQNMALVWALATTIDQAAATSGGHPTLVMEEGSVSDLSFDNYHDHLTLCEVNNKEAGTTNPDRVQSRPIQIQEWRDIISLFYYRIQGKQATSLLLGLEAMRKDHADIEDPEPPLVGNFGHASQSIVNLILHGYGVPNVFDGDMNTGGLVLKGVPYQSPIGFLTLLESLHYCQVGSLLKNPRESIWLLGSDTHYTVVFSDDTTLVCPEPRESRAKRIFQLHDKEGNGFIQADQVMDVLGEVVAAGCCPHIDITANLTDQQRQLEDLAKRLDPERMGIVLLTTFLNIVAPAKMDAPTARIPNHFVVWHYNGLGLSNREGRHEFRKGV